MQHQHEDHAEARAAGPGPVTNSSVSGAANSRNVPACAIALARREGAQVVGIRDEQPPPQRRALQQRVVRRHDRDDVAEGDRELRDARPEPDRELHRLAGRRSSSRRSRKQTIIAKWCSTRAASRIVLSASPQSGSSTTIGSSCAAPISGATSARSSESEKRRVERDVEPGARRAAEQRQVGERRQLGRARPQEVQEGGERRPDVEAERAAHAAEAQHLEEAGPEERLLERDRPRSHHEPKCRRTCRAPA